MVCPSPNCTRSPLISAIWVSTISTTSLRTGRYWMWMGSKCVVFWGWYLISLKRSVMRLPTIPLVPTSQYTCKGRVEGNSTEGRNFSFKFTKRQLHVTLNTKYVPSTFQKVGWLSAPGTSVGVGIVSEWNFCNRLGPGDTCPGRLQGVLQDLKYSKKLKTLFQNLMAI